MNEDETIRKLTRRTYNDVRCAMLTGNNSLDILKNYGWTVKEYMEEVCRDIFREEN